ncbi:MAG: hypothetical protein ACRYFR_17000 [Janthinobacterium lividum]
MLDQRKPGEATIPPADYTAQVYDVKTLAASYVTLSGLQRAQGPDGDLRVVVSMDGFTLGPTTALTLQNGKKVEGLTAQGPGVKHAYEVSYKSPMAVKVAAKDGTVLSDELLESPRATWPSSRRTTGAQTKQLFCASWTKTSPRPT